MLGQGSIALGQLQQKMDIFQAAANLANKSRYGTMIMDGLGRIRSCGTAVEEMFRTSQAELMGKRMCDLIANLLPSGSPPSYYAKRLSRLCDNRSWQKFEAKDVLGKYFTVELKLSRKMTDREEVFIISLRRPEDAEFC